MVANSAGPKTVDLGSPRLDAMAATFEHNDVGYIVKFAAEQGWITEVPGGLYRVSGKGFLQADEWKQFVPASTQAFVAMWIDPKTTDAWESGLTKGILAWIQSATNR
jgi:hypothetical protein